MKIGIITFWWSQDNYGQILQCYALQKYLRDMGHDAFLIRYLSDGDIVRTPIWKKIFKAFNIPVLIKYLKQNSSVKKIDEEKKSNNRFFDVFKNKYIVQSDIIYHKYSDLQKNPPCADIYIVGSDQVWNPFYIGGNKMEMFKTIANVYFLNFGNAKRVSYAASWGVKKLSKSEINIIKPLLAKFDYVSVREESGIDLCKKCGYENAEWVADPTMLLPASIYRNLYKNSVVKEIKEKYMFLYLLNNKHKISLDEIYAFGKKKGLKIVYVTGNSMFDKKEKCFAQIEEWLYYIDNAEFIITDSFHCGVFSTIFNKKYGILPLVGEKKEMNARFDSLFSRYKIAPRYLKSDDFHELYEDYSPNLFSFDFNHKLESIVSK